MLCRPARTFSDMSLKVLRLICTSTAVRSRNVAAAGPEKYTEAFIKKQIEEFNVGKRHLANMMGEDPETFTQEDIDVCELSMLMLLDVIIHLCVQVLVYRKSLFQNAIKYIFPSGLFNTKARPLMKHPLDVFPKQKAIQWGEDGRPFHFLFYTGKQSYYSLMHDTYEKLLNIQKHEDHMRAKGVSSDNTVQINLIGSRWLIKEELEEILVEHLSDQDYMRFIQLLERISTQPYCNIEEGYIMKFRKKLETQLKKLVIEPLQYDDRGIAFSKGEGKRKTARASVVLYDNGTGKITVNGVDYAEYFAVLQHREQLMFPFQFLDRLGKHDMVCTVLEGGKSSQAGAIRLASSKALMSFVTVNEVEFMRQAGLLTTDPRVRERKKPGQEGARRKFTWKKR
ncbi:small ribosomal subunit protein uS9m isoform X1 [Microcaecilia unicolor]|uniref:Small ribosomal subunit protein uS9m n=1 Tax=Microcaecilia unicolor TaxID=1415580 RepID=A0A6P7XXP9_9AMPH|nr:28S ribosomal protein S9, mitochondrial isoform X1 [Microcaecilia unicolor]